MGAGLNAQGVVLCNQPRALDLSARGARFAEKAPPEVVEEVMAKVIPIFE
jgi:mRNA-degrading endonuclease toxin of MazEF toxin-antitoxin module